MNLDSKFRISRQYDEKTASVAKELIANLGIPKGSLGSLHNLAVNYSGICGSIKTEITNPQIIIFCADHGVSKQNVSAFHRSATYLNSKQILKGEATISTFAKKLGIQLALCDVGIDSDKTLKSPGNIKFYDRKVSHGTSDFSMESAMSISQARESLIAGYNLVKDNFQHIDLLILGEMGIGNTTCGSLINSFLLNLPVSEVTGRGSGIGDEILDNKIRIIQETLNRLRLSGISNTSNIYDILCEIGGFELNAICGAMIYAAQKGIPVLIDGYLVSISALIAKYIDNKPLYNLMAATISTEIGMMSVAQHLEWDPILDLKMRLGEASAAVLAYPILNCSLSQLGEINNLDVFSIE